ncbi:hypothetical protein CEXT_366071 [Caerostris extrusa]|uniref:Ig-like domain-containing protein n=1 Tax=Caerostris extrusa TaxID=172846 RepID=A0AAV4N1B2_CAEEX|nr:hypothetical protein CEXT_366071 [Caerostris extrusa]
MLSEPPVLLSKFEELIVKPGESVSLRCSAVGNPLPQITWYSYDMPVQDTSRIRVGDYVSREGSVISFINITRVEILTADSMNAALSMNTEWTLFVHRPRQDLRPSGPYRIEQQSLGTSFDCPLSGYPATPFILSGG